MKIVAVTACPAGIAHTYMAKKGLQKSAKKLGHKIKVETQGSMGIENEIKEKDLQMVDIVIMAIDTKIDKESRFEGLKMHEVPVADAVKNPDKVMTDAISSIE